MGIDPSPRKLRRCDSLIEIRLGDLEEGAVTVGFDGEDEGLSGEHSELSHHLARLRQEQADVLGLVDHALVDVEAAPEHKVEAHVLPKRHVVTLG